MKAKPKSYTSLCLFFENNTRYRFPWAEWSMNTNENEGFSTALDVPTTTKILQWQWVHYCTLSEVLHICVGHQCLQIQTWLISCYSFVLVMVLLCVLFKFFILTSTPVLRSCLAQICYCCVVSSYLTLALCWLLLCSRY